MSTTLRRAIALCILAAAALMAVVPAATAEPGTADLAEHGAWLDANPAIADAMANPVGLQPAAKQAGISRPALPTHSAITAPAYDVCAWTGVQYGYLIPGSDKSELWRWRRFWYIDHYWIECVAIIRVGTVSCVKWIISTHDGHAVHLGNTPC
jgi:hypothetical protein